MSLESIVKEIASLKPFAEENVESGPVETLNGRRGRKNQAILRIGDLRQEYTNELQRSALYIVVTGAKRNEFEEVATGEKFGLFSSDPETFYKDLANRIHPSLYQGKASPSNLFDVLGRHLEDKMNELGVNEYNQIVFREKYVQSCDTAEEFELIVKTAVNEQIGSEIVGVQAVNSIVDKAISAGYTARTTPIILNTGDQTFVLQLLNDLRRLTGRVYLVNAGKVSKELKSFEGSLNLKDVTEDSVKDTLDQIKNSLKR